jgi:hypothetical protein
LKIALLAGAHHPRHCGLSILKQAAGRVYDREQKKFMTGGIFADFC